MEIYYIALIENTTNKVASNKYNQYRLRMLNLDTGEIKDVTVEQLLMSVKENPNIFKNVEINTTEKELVLNEHENRTLIVPHIKDGKLAQGSPKYTVLKKLYADNEYVISDRYGNTKIVEGSKLYDFEYNNDNSIDRMGGHIGNVGFDDFSPDLVDKILFLNHVYFEKQPHGNSAIEQKVKAEYEKFKAITIMMQLDINFEYSVIGKEVKLVNYSGSSTDVIIPKFITIIGEQSFGTFSVYGNRLRSLKLSEGLKIIEKGAFSHTRIPEVVIPSSVELIKLGAFYGSPFYKKNRIADTNKFKLLSNETIVEDGIIDSSTGQIVNSLKELSNNSPLD